MKKKYIAGSAIVLLTVLIFAFWPGEGENDIARMRAMYQRGHHEAVIVQLEEELQVRPDWHEARELLVFAALKADRVDMALEHLVELEKAGQYLDMMTGQLDLWLERNSLAEEVGAIALAAARAGVENSPDWLWIRRIYTDLIMTLERIEEIPRAVELVPEYVTSYFALNDKFDYTLLWELCVLVDESNHSSHRKYAVERIWDVDKLQHLHREHPWDPVLAAGLALCQGGNRGLSFLRKWEEDNYVDEICSDYYSQVKGQLLSAADNIDQKDFNLVLPEHVLDAAVESIAEPGRCRILLSQLEEGNHFPEQRKIVEDALGAQPIFTSREPLRRWASLSPDGKWLGVSTSFSDSIIFDVETSEAVLLEDLNPWNWCWAPDSTKVAVNGAWGSSRLYSTQGKLLHTVEIDGLEYNTHGWHGDNKLWVAESERLSLFLYDLETGGSQPYQYGAVFPGPAGNLAWKQGSATIVEMGGKTTSFQSVSVVSWLPDGSGLLLIKDDSIHLWTGLDSVELGIPGKFSFLGWRNDEEFYWTEFDGSSYLPRKLRGYNIRTREERDYKLPGYWAAAEGSRAVRSGYSIQVYELP